MIVALDESSRWPPGNPPSSALSEEDARAPILAAYATEALDDDAELSALVRFAARLCDTPVALLTLVDAERQRFLAREGVDLRETPRSLSFCAHAMLGGGPMEVRDARADARFADNAMVTGEEHVRFYAGAPLISPEGAPLGALCVLDRVPRPEGLSELQRHGLEVLAQTVMRRLQSHRQRRDASQVAHERARHMREIADLVPAIVWSADKDGRFDYFNSRWSAVTGVERPVAVGDWRQAVHRDDVDGTNAAWQASFAKGSPFESEFRLRQADGSWRWTLARAVPLLGPEGKVVRWYGTLTDIDEGRRLSQNRDLLARELSHRIKNIFAVLSGLIAVKARKHPEARSFANELVGAIRALARAHGVVRPFEGDAGSSLRGLLSELMAPYADERGRVEIVGEDCTIGPRATTPLALVFHELATNAAKYGALSSAGGSVTIAIDCSHAEDRARVAWRERGGPPPQAERKDGFGSRLIKLAVEGQLGGTVEHRFAPGGLEIDLELPHRTIGS